MSLNGFTGLRVQLSSPSIICSLFPHRDIYLIIQVLGGSSAIFYVCLSMTSFQKEVSFTSFYLSSLYGFLFIETPLPIFLFFFVTLIFLPRDWVFFLLLIGRCFPLEGGFALLMQISFLYILKERSWLTVSLPFAMICSYYILPFWIPWESS